MIKDYAIHKSIYIKDLNRNIIIDETHQAIYRSSINNGELVEFLNGFIDNDNNDHVESMSRIPDFCFLTFIVNL